MNTRWKNVKDDPFAVLPNRWAQAARSSAVGPTDTIPPHPKMRFTRCPAMPAYKGVRQVTMRVQAGAYATGGYIQPRSM